MEQTGKSTEVEIIREDKEFLVVRKPAGIAVQSGRVGQMDLEHLLFNRLAAQTSGTALPWLSVVHRLDQPVEGLLLFARSQKAAAALSAQLTDHRMKKEYLAVTASAPSAPEGDLEQYLLRDSRTNRSRVADAKERGAKKAILHYRCLAVDSDGHALLRILLQTGRHHQIRVQLSSAGFPILGDRKYGTEAFASALSYPALCAARLSFVHPRTGETVSCCTLPENPAFAAPEFQPILRSFGAS